MNRLLFFSVCSLFLMVFSGCNSVPETQAPVEGTTTNAHSKIVMKFAMRSYGPTPLFESQFLRDYMGRLQERINWRLGIACRNNRLANNSGQQRLQFHLNSDGKVTDVIVLTNTVGEGFGELFKEAVVGGIGFEPWPKDASHRRRAGYFTMRTVFWFENVTNSGPDSNQLETERLRAGLILPGALSNRLAIVLTNFQTDPDFLLEGVSERRTGNLTGAIADFTRAIDWDPSDAWAYTFRGGCRESLKDYDGAIPDINRAIEIDPQNAEALNERSIARFHLKDYAGSVSDCTGAISLDPQYPAPYDNRVRAEIYLQDFDKALADVGKALEYGPTNATAFFNRARIRYFRHEYDSSLSDCSKAIEFRPNYAAACAYRGYIQEELADFQGAIGSLRKSLTLDDTLNYSRFQIWIIRSKSGEMDEATQELRSHLQHRPAEKTPDWPYEVEAFLAGSLDEDQLFKAANEQTRTAQEHSGHICEAAYYAGMKHLLSNDKTGAAKLFQECISTGKADFIEYVQATRELKGIPRTGN